MMELRHPNIVELMDVVHRGSRLYLVLEFLETDLKRLMDATYPEPLPLAWTQVGRSFPFSPS